MIDCPSRIHAFSSWIYRSFRRMRFCVSDCWWRFTSVQVNFYCDNEMRRACLLEQRGLLEERTEILYILGTNILRGRHNTHQIELPIQLGASIARFASIHHCSTRKKTSQKAVSHWLLERHSFLSRYSARLC